MEVPDETHRVCEISTGSSQTTLCATRTPLLHVILPGPMICHLGKLL